MKSHPILISLIIALLAGTAANAKYSGGTGEPNNPYRIATPQNLNDIGNHREDWNKYFVLVNDVNLAEYTGTQFKIIGDSTKRFTGVFDGNDRKILNFTWIYQGTSSSYIGLFGYVGIGGQIKNLGMENVNIRPGNGWYVGGLVGENWDGTITNCYSSGSVSGGSNLGGLVGYNIEGTIISCYSLGSVSGNGGVGGMVGYNSDGTIINSYSTGNVSGDRWVGGLVGLNFFSEITDCYSIGGVSGGDCVGGLVGWNIDSGTITSCYSTGSVTGNSDVGGLVGRNYKGAAVSSFWDIEASDCNTSAGGTGKTTAEMKTESTFTDAGWDFVNIWDICEGTNYPRLRWQIPLAISMGDFVCPYGVNLADFATLASAWRTEPNDPDWNPTCDVSQPKDNVINEFDLAVLCENWLKEK